MNYNEHTKKLLHFFEETAEKVAKKAKFVQRRSKITGSLFLKMLVLGSIELAKPSLHDWVRQIFNDKKQIQVSEQAIDQRFNEYSVEFTRQMFQESLKEFKTQQKIDIELFESFSSVYLLDSSQITLPESLEEFFKGSGGNRPKSSVKVQCVFELLQGNYHWIEFKNGIDPDQTYGPGIVDLLQAGSLMISDLGYFNMQFLKPLNELNFFVCRLQSQTAIFTGKEGEVHKRLEFKKLLAKAPKIPFELDVIIGSRKADRVPCRLVCIPVSEEIANRRRQKAKEKAKAQKKNITQEYLAMQGWSICITNVSKEVWNTLQVFQVYRIRWAIEILFKVWKSGLSIHQFAQAKSHRIRTELYARFIAILWFQVLINPIYLRTWQSQGTEISFFKAIKQIKDRLSQLKQVWLCVEKMNAFFCELEKSIRKICLKTRRKKDLTLLQILDNNEFKNSDCFILNNPIELLDILEKGGIYNVEDFFQKKSMFSKAWAA